MDDLLFMRAKSLFKSIGILWLGVLGAALSSNGLSATYYIDQSAGNDSNNGTSASTPWKNCPGMSAYAGSGTLRPGDTVYFDRGDTWLVTGGQGLYLTGGVTYIGNSWGSGTKARIRANADLDAGVVRFRDHATVATVFEGFEIDANGKVTTGVDINHAYWQLMNGATKRLKDCEVHHTWSRVASSQYKYGVIVSNFGGTAGYCENVEIINCVVHDTSRDAICLYPGDVNKDCRIRNILVRGCESFNTGQDPDYGAGAGIITKGFVQDVIIENNFMHDTKGAGYFVNGNETKHYPGVGPTNIHFRFNIVTCNSGHGAIRIYDGASGKDPKDLKIYGNLVYNSPSSGGVYIGGDLGNTLRVLMYNNTFYNSPVSLNANSATFEVFEFKNNIVYHPGGTPLLDAQRKITAHSNNIYYRSSGTLVSAGGTSYDASSLGNYESTALAGNPLLKGTTTFPTGFTGVFGSTLVPNNDSMSLQSASPGIDNGVALVAGFNGSVNSVGRPAGARWDIGAYEFGSGAQKPAPPTNLRVE